LQLGVDPEPGAKLNPFTSLLDHFNEDDFIVVKLGETCTYISFHYIIVMPFSSYPNILSVDIDTSPIENKLAAQLRNDTKLSNLVDVFYYEHHVMQGELLRYWGNSASGSVGDSLEMMSDIRRKGVASHYWP
jgi:hypothetical protein